MAFVIGNKAYIGTGMNGTSLINDFWEYDPAIDKWTVKTKFPGTPRRDAIGFAIDNKGYIGLGSDSKVKNNDLYEYDPQLDKWIVKASLPASIRDASIVFTLGNKAYLTTGRNGSSVYNDLWEYDAINNKWSQKLNYAGVARSESVSFVIGLYAFVGLGHTGGAVDFWAYNQLKNSWTVATNFPGGERFESVSFSIGNKGYVGLGSVVGKGLQNDFWEYDLGTTDLDEINIQKDEFSVYPNPISNYLNLLLPSNDIKQLELTIFDVNGKEVFKKQFVNFSIMEKLNIPEFVNGDYFVQVVTYKGKVFNKKISILK